MIRSGLAGALATIMLAACATSLPAQERAMSLVGTWRGSYVCLQGSTGLTLSVTKQSGNRFSGFFHFYPTRWGPVAKEGCYSVDGTLDKSGSIIIDTGRWITQPDGYVMVGLRGTLDKTGLSMSGQVKAPPPIENGCQAFELNFNDPVAQVDDVCKGSELQASLHIALPQ